MKFKNLFSKPKKTQNELLEVKSMPLNASFTEFLFNNGHGDLSAATAISFYKQIAPLYTAVDIISNEVKSINPIVWDTKSKKVVNNHPIFELVRNPNADVTWEEFIERIVLFERVTGNSFIFASGSINRPPLEVFVVPTQNVTLDNGSDSFTDTITITGVSESIQFNRATGSPIRFISGTNREIYQIRTANPNPLGCRNFGMSPLNPIMLEIEQYHQSSIHNLSLLMRGARMSAVFSFDDELSDDQRERVKEQLTKFYGSQNAGSAMFAEAKMKVNELGTTNKDMDFFDLKKDVTNAIYTAFRIPLPVVTPDNMTLANLEAGHIALYDNAIIPLAKKVYSELTNFLMPRYPGSENLILTFDENDIPALEARRAAKLKSRSDLNMLTKNELRAMDMLEPLSSGGDRLYQNSNLVPFARDQDTSNDIQENEGVIEDNTDKSFSYKSNKFIEDMRSETDLNGNRLFTDDEIDRIAKENDIL